jgi:hypothetical protein
MLLVTEMTAILLLPLKVALKLIDIDTGGVFTLRLEIASSDVNVITL